MKITYKFELYVKTKVNKKMFKLSTQDMVECYYRFLSIITFPLIKSEINRKIKRYVASFAISKKK